MLDEETLFKGHKGYDPRQGSFWFFVIIGWIIIGSILFFPLHNNLHNRLDVLCKRIEKFREKMTKLIQECVDLIESLFIIFCGFTDCLDELCVEFPLLLNIAQLYKGKWNADTNTPFLSSGTGDNGETYLVNVNGSTNLDGETDWDVGDMLIFDETTAKWHKNDGSPKEVLIVVPPSVSLTDSGSDNSLIIDGIGPITSIHKLRAGPNIEVNDIGSSIEIKNVLPSGADSSGLWTPTTTLLLSFNYVNVTYADFYRIGDIVKFHCHGELDYTNVGTAATFRISVPVPRVGNFPVFDRGTLYLVFNFPTPSGFPSPGPGEGTKHLATEVCFQLTGTQDFFCQLSRTPLSPEPKRFSMAGSYKLGFVF